MHRVSKGLTFHATREGPGQASLCCSNVPITCLSSSTEADHDKKKEKKDEYQK